MLTQLRILIVDDNALVRALAQQICRRRGHLADAVSGGDEALGMWLAESYDVVLLDIQMPGWDGLEVAREMRRIESTGLRRRTPILAVTGYASAEQQHLCLQAGMDGIIAKPFHRDELLGALEEIALPPTEARDLPDNRSTLACFV